MGRLGGKKKKKGLGAKKEDGPGGEAKAKLKDITRPTDDIKMRVGAEGFKPEDIEFMRKAI